MDWQFISIFLGCLAFGILRGVVRSRNNPLSEVDYSTLPADLQTEIARVLPDFTQSKARLSKRGDKARVDGQSAGRAIRIEGEFDAQGSMIEFELETAGGMRTKERSSQEAIPTAAAAEIDRVLGQPTPVFDRTVVTTGTIEEEPHFEFKGYAPGCKWEIVVSAEGQLHEVEKELRRARG